MKPIKLIVSANVRYWEDAEINGRIAGEDGNQVPLKSGNLWEPVIELATGRVIGWPEGTTGDIHFKVCDAGEYWLQDANGNRYKWKGDYVPDHLLCIGDRGYGDYIILKINSDGIIDGWEMPEIDEAEWEKL